MRAVTGIVGMTLLSAYALAFGQSPTVRTIGVVGTGEIDVPPAEVVVSIGIDTFDDDIVVTRSERDSILRGVLASVQRAGIDRENIETSGFSIRPRYDRQRGVTGYDSSVWVTVTLDRASELESYVADALSAGATQVRTVQFVPENADEALAQAQSMALENARETASRMAAELGADLGPVISIRDEGFCVPPGCGKPSAIMASGRIEPGTTATGFVTVTARVFVEFELEVPNR